MPRPDTMGDRIKAYEARETERRAMAGVPLVVRVDGRSFSAFTAGLARPFDMDFADLMLETAKYLLENLDGARVAYTQSDEISLVLDPFGTPSADEVLRTLELLLDRAGPAEPEPEDDLDVLEALDDPRPDTRESLKSLIESIRQGAPPPERVIDFMFRGRLHKLTSVSAGMATARFLKGALALWPERCERSLPVFDSRVFEVPSRIEAVNALAWREVDAMKNAVSMAARAHFRPEDLHGKSAPEMRRMLREERGVEFDHYPVRLRRGVYLQRRRVSRELPPEVLARIPDGRRPAGPVTRRETVVLDLPPTWHLANRVEVLLEGAAPVLRPEARAA